MADYLIALTVTCSVLILGICFFSWQALRRLSHLKATSAEQNKAIERFIREVDERWEQQNGAATETPPSTASVHAPQSTAASSA
jgi:hypothetical protein